MKIGQTAAFPFFNAAGLSALRDNPKDRYCDIQYTGDSGHITIHLNGIAIAANVAIARVRDQILQALLRRSSGKTRGCRHDEGGDCPNHSDCLPIPLGITSRRSGRFRWLAWRRRSGGTADCGCPATQ